MPDDKGIIDTFISEVLQWIEWLVGTIAAWFEQLAWDFGIWVQEMIGPFLGWFEQTFQTFFLWFEQITGEISLVVQSIITTLEELISGLWGHVTELFDSALIAIQGFVQDTWLELGLFVDEITTGIGLWISEGTSAIVQMVDDAAIIVGGFIEDFGIVVSGAIEDITGLITTTVTTLTGSITESFDTMLGGASSLIGAIESRLADLGQAFANSVTDLLEGMEEFAGDTMKDTRAFMNAATKEVVEFANPDETSALIDSMNTLSKGDMNVTQLRAFLNTGWQKVVPDSPFWRSVFLGLLTALGSVGLMMQLVNISGSVMIQEFGREFPYALLAPADASQAWRHGLLPKEVAIDTIRRQGFSEENAGNILAMTETLPQSFELLSHWHRGFIDDETLEANLKQQGFDPPVINRLKQASFVIPPVADLIAMAVREAFSPEIVARFGQMEDFPPDFGIWAERQGLTEDWAKKYWAAHWGLPSPLQGFEMLHRGVISKDDLSLLLRALDVMPFWRDKLTAIAYSPFTRVDVRRMHKLGVLDDAGVTRAYKDIGYDDDKAAALLEFTKLYNAPPSADDENEVTDLSRASVLRFYRSGLLPQSQAIELLTELGYTDQAAQLYIADVDLSEEEANRKDEIQLVLDLAKAGILTIGSAEAKLTQLGLSHTEVQRALAKLVQESQRKTKLPSRADAERMYRVHAITLQEYKTLLDVQGYAQKWVDGYVAVLEAGNA